MKQIYFEDVITMAKYAKGNVNKIYLHWTAGGYDEVFPDYHINITGDGRLYTHHGDLTEKLKHTWHRNSNAIGIALCCCKDAMMISEDNFSLGVNPPTASQIESLAILVALLTDILEIPLNAENVMTHAEAADLDNYGPKMAGTKYFEKWDLYQLPDFDGVWRSGGLLLRGKAAFYKTKL